MGEREPMVQGSVGELWEEFRRYLCGVRLSCSCVVIVQTAGSTLRRKENLYGPLGQAVWCGRQG